MGDYFFAWEALSAPCGGTFPQGKANRKKIEKTLDGQGLGVI